MKKQLMAFLRDEEGLTIVEYAVAAGLIAGDQVVSLLGNTGGRTAACLFDQFYSFTGRTRRGNSREKILL